MIFLQFNIFIIEIINNLGTIIKDLKVEFKKSISLLKSDLLSNITLQINSLKQLINSNKKNHNMRRQSKSFIQLDVKNSDKKQQSQTDNESIKTELDINNFLNSISSRKVSHQANIKIKEVITEDKLIKIEESVMFFKKLSLKIVEKIYYRISKFMSNIDSEYCNAINSEFIKWNIDKFANSLSDQNNLLDSLNSLKNKKISQIQIDPNGEWMKINFAIDYLFKMLENINILELANNSKQKLQITLLTEERFIDYTNQNLKLEPQKDINILYSNQKQNIKKYSQGVFKHLSMHRNKELNIQFHLGFVELQCNLTKNLSEKSNRIITTPLIATLLLLFNKKVFWRQQEIIEEINVNPKQLKIALLTLSLTKENRILSKEQAQTRTIMDNEYFVVNTNFKFTGVININSIMDQN